MSLSSTSHSSSPSSTTALTSLRSPSLQPLIHHQNHHRGRRYTSFTASSILSLVPVRAIVCVAKLGRHKIFSDTNLLHSAMRPMMQSISAKILKTEEFLYTGLSHNLADSKTLFARPLLNVSYLSSFLALETRLLSTDINLF
ncbi:hypothetical protein KCU73_g118, partial [Aureobasidium melanogenum]